jgi:hypothetical protein
MPGKEDAMSATVKQMLETANAAVPRITPAQAREMIAKGNVLVIDVRDPPEVQQSGKVAGAVNVSRGMLEFRADPESPYHDKNFAKKRHHLLRLRRALGPGRQGAQGHGLRAGPQSRRVQGLGRGRRRRGQAERVGRSPDARSHIRGPTLQAQPA